MMNTDTSLQYVKPTIELVISTSLSQLYLVLPKALTPKTLKEKSRK